MGIEIALAGTVIFFIIIAFLLKNRFQSQSGARQGYIVGNAQFIGTRENQNDYFTVFENNNLLFAAVADGLTDRQVGKKAAIMAIEILKNNFRQLQSFENLQQYFKNSYGDIDRAMHMFPDRYQGTMMVIAVLRQGIMEWSSMGNVGLFLYEANEIKRLNQSENKRIQFGQIFLKNNQSIMICTHGACQSLTESEMVRVLSKKIHPYLKAQELSKIIIQKGYMFQENATILILQKKALYNIFKALRLKNDPTRRQI